jgi:ribosomal protein S2
MAKRRKRNKTGFFSSALAVVPEDFLVASIAHCPSPKYLNQKTLPYLLGLRDNFYFFDINYLYGQSKIVLSFLTNIISLRNNLLILYERDPAALLRILNTRGILYYDQKWVGGTLTNFRKVQFSLRFVSENGLYFKLCSMRFFPGLVFIADINLSY